MIGAEAGALPNQRTARCFPVDQLRKHVGQEIRSRGRQKPRTGIDSTGIITMQKIVRVRNVELVKLQSVDDVHVPGETFLEDLPAQLVHGRQRVPMQGRVVL